MKKPKKQREQEKLAALLGMTTPKTEANPYESEEDISREAEAVLAFAADSSYFIQKECKSCGRTFAHTRGAVAYCSNHCRAVALEKIGIKWHWLKPGSERWGPWPHAEPLVVPPGPLDLLKTVYDAKMKEVQDKALAFDTAFFNEEQPEKPQPVEVSETATESVDVLDLLHDLGLD